MPPPGVVVQHCGLAEPHPHVTAPLRFHYRKQDVPLPPGVSPDQRFRNRIREVPTGRVGRCQVPHSLPHEFEAMDKALEAAAFFLKSLQEQ